MSGVSSQHARSQPALRRVELTLRSTSTFPVPYSDGYSVYGALLSALGEVDADASERIHDAPLGSLHSSGLIGPFGDSDHAYHKSVRADAEYRLSLGIVDPADIDIFQALVNAVVLEGDSLELSHGTLRVETVESENKTHAELLETAAETTDPTLEVRFRTPTCIEETGEVTTMFPTRQAVFTSLLGKWNQTAPDDLKVDLSRDALARSVIEKPDPDRYDTHSVLVSRGETADGETRSIMKQGFTGVCEYAFKDASESVVNAVTALALFGEYSGVGSAVARGCGALEVETG